MVVNQLKVYPLSNLWFSRYVNLHPYNVGEAARWMLGPVQWDARLSSAEYDEGASSSVVHHFEPSLVRSPGKP